MQRIATPVIYEENQKFEIGKEYKIGNGMDAAIITNRSNCFGSIKSTGNVKIKRINVRVIDIHTIKPIDKELIVKCAKETGKVITVEDHKHNWDLEQPYVKY